MTNMPVNTISARKTYAMRFMRCSFSSCLAALSKTDGGIDVETEHRMKRIAYVFLAEIVLTGMLVMLAGAQSEPLGDYARAVRKENKKEVGKKYDNDNLPVNDKISIVGNAPDSPGPE